MKRNNEMLQESLHMDPFDNSTDHKESKGITIYFVEAGHNYEGGDVLKAFRSKDAAEEFRKITEETNNNFYDFVLVKEIELV